MNGHFIGDLKLHELVGHNGEWFVLMEDLAYVDVDPKTGVEVGRHLAEAGVLTNFASIPIFRRNGRHNRADVIHDDQCTRKPFPSPVVHGLYRRMLWACDCSWWIVYSFWLAVRLFGPKF